MQHTGWDMGSIWGVPNSVSFVLVCFSSHDIFSKSFASTAKLKSSKYSRLSCCRKLFQRWGASFESHLTVCWLIPSPEPFFPLSFPKPYSMLKGFLTWLVQKSTQWTWIKSTKCLMFLHQCLLFYRPIPGILVVLLRQSCGLRQYKEKPKSNSHQSKCIGSVNAICTG